MTDLARPHFEAKIWNNRQIQANFTVFLHGDREKFEVATISVTMASKSMQFLQSVFLISHSDPF